MSVTDTAEQVARRTAEISALRRRCPGLVYEPVNLPGEDAGEPVLDAGRVAPPIGEIVDPALRAMTEGYLRPLLAAIPVRPWSSGPIRYDDPEVLARESARRAKADARFTVDSERHTALLARLDGPLREVADLHAPQRASSWQSDCQGCDPGEYAEGTPEFPCSTWELIDRLVTAAENGRAPSLLTPTDPATTNGDPRS